MSSCLQRSYKMKKLKEGSSHLGTTFCSMEDHKDEFAFFVENLLK